MSRIEHEIFVCQGLRLLYFKPNSRLYKILSSYEKELDKRKSSFFGPELAVLATIKETINAL